MKTLYYIHWNEAELEERIKPLLRAGYTVHSHHTTHVTADLKDKIPDVLIINIDRLPSHGKAYAEWLWQAKKRQHIPIVFCGGKPEKKEAFQQQFPLALFCEQDKLEEIIGGLR